MELNAQTRLVEADSTPVEAAPWPPGFPWYVRHKETKFIVAGFVNHDEAEKFVTAMGHGMYRVSDSSITRSRYDIDHGNE
jgi:hypothetical protein